MRTPILKKARRAKQNPMINRLSEEQLDDLRTVFRRFDRNNDGRVSATEMAQVLREVGRNPTDEQVRQIVRTMDLDRSGQIEFEEFAEAMASILLEPLEDQEIKEAFRSLDKDGSGKICARELKRAAQRMGMCMNDRELEEMIRMADSDGDGQVSYEEFCKMMK